MVILIEIFFPTFQSFAIGVDDNDRKGRLGSFFHIEAAKLDRLFNESCAECKVDTSGEGFLDSDEVVLRAHLQI